MNDLDLRDLVLEELEFKPDINAASIGVTVAWSSWKARCSCCASEKWSSVRPGRCRASARSKIIC